MSQTPADLAQQAICRAEVARIRASGESYINGYTRREWVIRARRVRRQYQPRKVQPPKEKPSSPPLLGTWNTRSKPALTLAP